MPKQVKSALPKGKGAEKYKGAKFIKPIMHRMPNGRIMKDADMKKTMKSDKRIKVMPKKRYYA